MVFKRKIKKIKVKQMAKSRQFLFILKVYIRFIPQMVQYMRLYSKWRICKRRKNHDDDDDDDDTNNNVDDRMELVCASSFSKLFVAHFYCSNFMQMILFVC